MRDRYGLDRSLPEKYVHWLQSIARGELGFSVAYNSPVGPLLWPRARNTLLLTVTATALAWLIAVPVGTWAASRQGGWADRVAAGATTALLGVPDLLLGLGSSAAGRAHRLFPDRRNGLARLCRARPVGQGEGRPVPFLPARHGADPGQPAGARQARSRQPDRRPPGAVHPGGTGDGHSRAAPAVSPRVACRREPVDFAAGALRRRRCSARRSSSKRS